jgi:hypothetical protein
MHGEIVKFVISKCFSNAAGPMYESFQFKGYLWKKQLETEHGGIG